MVLVRWFLLSVQFATTIPVPNTAKATDYDFRASMVFFPTVGLLLGVVLYGVQAVLSPWMPGFVTAVVSLVLYTLLTGALHIDGFMDVADALGSRQPRDRAIEIMKDSRVGAMGAIAGSLLMIGKISALVTLQPSHLAPYLVVPMFSRLGVIWSMVLAPSARAGQGLGGFYAQRLPAWVPIASTIFAVACSGWLLQDGAWLIAVLIYSIVVSVLFTLWMMRRFGGTTGDTYGALNELLEWVGFYVFIVIYHR